MSDANQVSAPAAAPASGGSKLVPLLLVANTALMGAVIFLVMRKPAAATAAAAAAAPAEAPADEAKRAASSAAAEAPGVILKLENFVIQLKSIDTDRYVRVAFDLEVPTEVDKTALVARVSHVRDAVIAYFSDRTVEELRGSEGMERTKAALLKRLDEVVPGRRIKSVLVTEFIVQ